MAIKRLANQPGEERAQTAYFIFNRRRQVIARHSSKAELGVVRFTKREAKQQQRPRRVSISALMMAAPTPLFRRSATTTSDPNSRPPGYGLTCPMPMIRPSRLRRPGNSPNVR